MRGYSLSRFKNKQVLHIDIAYRDCAQEDRNKMRFAQVSEQLLNICVVFIYSVFDRFRMVYRASLCSPKHTCSHLKPH